MRRYTKLFVGFLAFLLLVQLSIPILGSQTASALSLYQDSLDEDITASMVGVGTSMNVLNDGATTSLQGNSGIYSTSSPITLKKTNLPDIQCSETRIAAFDLGDGFDLTQLSASLRNGEATGTSGDVIGAWNTLVADGNVVINGSNTANFGFLVCSATDSNVYHTVLTLGSVTPGGGGGVPPGGGGSVPPTCSNIITTSCLKDGNYICPSGDPVPYGQNVSCPATGVSTWYDANGTLVQQNQIRGRFVVKSPLEIFDRTTNTRYIAKAPLRVQGGSGDDNSILADGAIWYRPTAADNVTITQKNASGTKCLGAIVATFVSGNFDDRTKYGKIHFIPIDIDGGVCKINGTTIGGLNGSFQYTDPSAHWDYLTNNQDKYNFTQDFTADDIQQLYASHYWAFKDEIRGIGINVVLKRVAETDVRYTATKERIGSAFATGTEIWTSAKCTEGKQPSDGFSFLYFSPGRFGIDHSVGRMMIYDQNKGPSANSFGAQGYEDTWTDGYGGNVSCLTGINVAYSPFAQATHLSWRTTASKNLLSISYPENANKTEAEVGNTLPGGLAPPADTNGNTGQGASSCESMNGFLGWIACPVIKAMSAGINAADTYIQAQLQADIPNLTYTNEAGQIVNQRDSLKTVWVRIRDLAYIILVPIMLVMVIGTALNIGPFDAYTVKKALPRMVAAVIFISLSWYICLFTINVTNVIGGGIRGIIETPFTSAYSGRCPDGITLACVFDGGIESFVTNGILILPTIAAALLIVWFFAGTALLFLAVTFAILVLRRIFVIALVLVSPLAILPWIFPANNKLWKAWWNSFSKLLMVYPLIMVLITIGHVFALIIDQADAGGIANFLLKLTAYVLPLVFIPTAFKFAGGAFATISGMANDRSKGLFDRQKKSRAERAHRFQHDRAFKNAPEKSYRQKFNTAAGMLFNAKELKKNPKNWGANYDLLHLRHTTKGRDEMLKDEDNVQAGNDNWNLAAAEARDENEFKSNLQRMFPNLYSGPAGERNLARDTAAYRSMSEKYGGSGALRSAALFRALAGGTVYGRDVNGSTYDWEKTVNEIAGEDESLRAELIGKARGIANQAGQLTQGGISHGTAMRISRSMQMGYRVDEYGNEERDSAGNRIGYTQTDAEQDRRRAAVTQQGPVRFFGNEQKLADTQSAAEVMDDMLENGVTGGEAGSKEGMEEFYSSFSMLEQLYTSMASLSPEKQAVARKLTGKTFDIASMTPEFKKVISKALLTVGPDGVVSSRVTGDVTASEILNALRGNREFAAFGRQYSADETEIAAANANAEAARAAMGGAADANKGEPK